jgi:hypothetical protein
LLFEPWPPKMGIRTRGILSSMVGTKKAVPHEAPEGTLPGKPIRTWKKFSMASQHSFSEGSMVQPRPLPFVSIPDQGCRRGETGIGKGTRAEIP